MTAIATTHHRRSRGRHLLAVPAPAAARVSDARTEARWAPLVIRLAVAADDAKLRRLAHLDSARPLSGQALLAEQSGSLVAALSLDDGAAIADPFVASADAVTMLCVRAAQLRESAATAA
ncbi:MAG: hypothetical protein KGL15_11940 [Acidobacteriota bacterium]|nr:hypothetical protein [Acidobacteriota bacterium]